MNNFLGWDTKNSQIYFRSLPTKRRKIMCLFALKNKCLVFLEKKLQNLSSNVLFKWDSPHKKTANRAKVLKKLCCLESCSKINADLSHYKTKMYKSCINTKKIWTSVNSLHLSSSLVSLTCEHQLHVF